MIDKRILIGGALLVGGFLIMRRANAGTVAADPASPAAVSSGVTSGGSGLSGLFNALLATSAPAPAPTYTLQAAEPAPPPAVATVAAVAPPPPAPAPAPVIGPSWDLGGYSSESFGTSTGF